MCAQKPGLGMNFNYGLVLCSILVVSADRRQTLEIPLFILFVLLLLFSETGLLCVALLVLKLILWTRVTLSSGISCWNAGMLAGATGSELHTPFSFSRCLKRDLLGLEKV